MILKNDGMQIDLLIERADDVVNVCEMKFYKAPFTITKSYAQVLGTRLQTLEKSPLRFGWKTILLQQKTQEKFLLNRLSPSQSHGH